MIVNLVKVSEYELRAESMKEVIAQVEQILLKGDVDDSAAAGGFNFNQRKEEHEKVVWLASHPEDAEAMFKLEDHPLMYGAIRALGTENVEFVDRFYSLFACNRALVDRALLTFGDYSMQVRDRYQFGSGGLDRPWRALFRNRQEQIGTTRNALVALLGKFEVFDDNKLQSILDQFLNVQGKLDWRRYLVKYETMHLQKYGMYRWKDGKKNSYEILAMNTEKNITTGRNWNVFLMALHKKIKAEMPEVSVHLGDYAYSHDGDKMELVTAKKFIGFEESAVKVYEKTVDHDGSQEIYTELESIDIPQNDGIDIVDRVELAFQKVVEIIKCERRLA